VEIPNTNLWLMGEVVVANPIPTLDGVVPTPEVDIPPVTEVQVSAQDETEKIIKDKAKIPQLV
jgi:hypothetical protein